MKRVFFGLIAVLLTTCGLHAQVFQGGGTTSPGVLRMNGASGSAASSFVIRIDSFTEGTDTGIASHTPDTGGTWSGSGSADLLVDEALDEVENVSSGFREMIGDDNPTTSRYFVEVVGKTGGATGSHGFGAYTRWTSDGTDDLYACFLDGAGKYNSFKKIGGSFSETSSGTLAGFSASTYYTIRAISDGDTFSCHIDGVMKTTLYDNATVTGNGNVGFGMENTSARITMLQAWTLP